MKDIIRALLKLLIAILIAAVRIGFAYGLILLFAGNMNPLDWSTTCKVWFVVIAVLLLSSD